MLAPIASRPVAGFLITGTLADSQVEFNEAESGSLALRLATLPCKASHGLPLPHAHLATWRMGNYQGRNLSSCWIGQA